MNRLSNLIRSRLSDPGKLCYHDQLEAWTRLRATEDWGKLAKCGIQAQPFPSHSSLIEEKNSQLTSATELVVTTLKVDHTFTGRAFGPSQNNANRYEVMPRRAYRGSAAMSLTWSLPVEVNLQEGSANLGDGRRSF